MAIYDGNYWQIGMYDGQNNDFSAKSEDINEQIAHFNVILDAKSIEI